MKRNKKRTLADFGVSDEALKLWLESFENGIWEHLAGYSLDKEDDEEEQKNIKGK